MKQSLLEEYLESHPDFISEMEQLSKTNKEKFIRNFKKEKDKTNFLSRISELRFAEFLVRESIDYEYEPIIEGKTPDFKFNLLTNSSTYFDVKRFNISDFDKLNDRKLYDLAERLKTIQKPYYVHIEQIKKKLEFDLDLAFNVIEKWILDKALKEGDAFNYENQFNIEVTKTNGIKDYVLYSYSGENPKINLNKPASDILSKIRTYQQVIIDKGLPFFVGIDLTFDTLKDPHDYCVQFLGGSCMNIDTKVESFQLGEFYDNSEFDGLTGLLIRYNNQFYWLNNPRNINQIEFRTAKSTYE
jgi:hypothetical protein